MSSIDERIVRARFDNSDFARGAKQTLDQLEQLKKSMKLDGASKGLDELSRSANRFNLHGLGQSVTAVGSQFSAMGAVALGALASIGAKAVQVGGQLLGSFSTSPIIDGFKEYETNLNSIQTILANTGLEGQAGLNKVNAALQNLNTYSDKTIYNFSEMAHNIGTFTAAGVKLDVATGAIKGIANLAALSGSNAQQASTAMYQLSQALASGKVSLMDWNSVVNAGMGGKVFQDALKETARNQGIAIDQIIKKNGSFRDSLQEGWLTDKVLTETLNKLTGDLTDTQLKAMGYTDKQIVGIQKLAKTASSAATDVKTASQLISTLQEALGSGWSQTFQTIFGDFNGAKTLFTSINNVLGGAIQQSSAARNKILADWAKGGGRDALFQGIANTFKFLGQVIKPIQEAFRDFFPPTTGAQLVALSKSFLAFTQGLKIGADTANNLKRTFSGVFAVFHIGFEVIKQVIGLFARLFGAVGAGSGGFLSTTASVGDFLVALDNALTKGGALADFFDGLGGILEVPIRLFQKLAGAVGDFIGGLDLSGAAPALANTIGALGQFANAGDLVDAAWTGLGNAIKPVWDFFMMIGDKISSVAGFISQGFQVAFAGVKFDDILKTINTGLFAALVLGVRKFMKNILGALSGEDSGPGIIDTIKETFGQLTSTLSTMQNTLKATTLLEIAAAVGILAASVVAIANIDGAGLSRALTGLGVMFGQLLGALLIFEKIAASGGIIRMPAVAASLILLATAVRILASAVKSMADLDWEQLAKGLTGTAGLLGALALFTRFAGVNASGIGSGAGIILLATGIKILASAVNDLGNLQWDVIGKGLLTMAGGLLIMGVALNAIPPSSVLSAAAILVTAASLELIAIALGRMGGMDWENIAKGLITLAGALTIISVALNSMTFALPGAAAMVVVAAGLAILTPVLMAFGTMDWENIAKAMVTLAGSLTIIAVAMLAMIPALPGAAALLVVSGALAVLAPVLLTLGGMSWESIAKGLLALAGAFLVIGAAGLLLGPLVPILIGLGAAITLLGVGMLAAGAGVLAFGVGLTAIAAAGAAAAAVLIGVVKGLIQLIPETMAAIGRGIIEFAKAISSAGPALTSAMITVMTSLLNAVATMAPRVIDTLLRMLSQFLQSMLNYVPRIVDAGLKLVAGILSGIARNIGQLVTKGTDVVVNFLRGIQANQGRVIDEGVKTVISFVNGVANAIRSNTGAMQSAGANLAFAIADGMTGGLASRVGSIASQAASMASSALNAAKSVLGINSPSKEFQKIGQYSVEGYVKGLRGSKDQILAAGKTMQDLLAKSAANAADDIARLQKRLATLNKARKKDRAEIRETTAALKQARVEQARTAAAQKLVKGKTFAGDNAKLTADAKKLDAIKPKLEAAQKALADAIKTRDDYQKSVKDQYSTLPQIDKDTQLADYVTELRQKIVDTRQFAEAVQKLRTMGLNDAAYKQLIEKGPDALPFVQQILAGGKGAVADLNTLGSQLDTAAKGLADGASKSLYQAAVDSAAGIVKGLQNQQKAIQAEMDKIAAAMVKAIKKALGIKSPSRVFAEVGEYSMDGLARGLSDSRPAVAAAEGAGKDAILAMRKTLSGLSTLALDSIDGTPTIRPVLDLSNVQRDASQLDTMLSGRPISVDAAYISAKGAQAGYDENADAFKSLQVAAASPAPTYQFTQNNTSPKALSDAEIYRQTKSLVSRAKGA